VHGFLAWRYESAAPALDRASFGHHAPTPELFGAGDLPTIAGG
jgi:hypothetical protein